MDLTAINYKLFLCLVTLNKRASSPSHLKSPTTLNPRFDIGTPDMKRFTVFFA